MDKHLTAEQVIELIEQHRYTALHIHHTWMPNHNSFTGNNHQKLQDGMRSYHMGSRGWSDIGQHLTIMPDGVCVTGRDFGRNPASISGKNVNAFAVEMVGDFDTGKDVFGGPQKDAMLQIAKYFYDNGIKIIFHREYSTKTCPGSAIDKDAFVSEVANYTKDTSESPVSWSDDARAWVMDKGISDGSNPKNFATREELWVMLYRYHNR